MRRWLILVLVFCYSFSPTFARERKTKSKGLDAYLARVRVNASAPQQTLPAGSLWDSAGLYADLSSDHKARTIGDLIVIRITEQTLAQSSASVTSQRKLEADSGISALGGKINTSGIENLFSPHSNQSLQGQGQTASKSLLQTSISGRVVALLPGNGLVVEAERSVLVNNERQHVIVRGVARMADVTQDNAILSTQLSDLEVEVEGKGVISDSTRPPNFVVRWLLKILGF
jgi:flagellar L-ring protein precursor FlgH